MVLQCIFLEVDTLKKNKNLYRSLVSKREATLVKMKVGILRNVSYYAVF